MLPIRNVEYGLEGIRRFVEGEYAWAMESAIMLAYRRGGYTIAQHLRSNLKNNSKDARFGKPTSPRKIPEARAGLSARRYASPNTRAISSGRLTAGPQRR